MLGVVVAAAYIALVAVFAANVNRSASNRVTANNAAVQVQTDFAPLNQAMNTFGTNTSQCRTAARPLACVTAADRTLADSFDTFAAQLRNVPMPSGATTAAGQLGNTAARAGLIFRRLAAAKSAARYGAVLATVNIDQAINRFSQDYQALGNALNQS